MKLESLRDLFIEQLRDLYSAESQLLKALPKMSKKATSQELKQSFDLHLEETKGQKENLEKIFKMLGEKPSGHTCKAMKGIIEEGEELMKEDATPEVLDAGLIAAAQRVEHYEIAGYGTVREYARELGENEIEQLLTKILNEEKRTDKKLTGSAESGINDKADTESGSGSGQSRYKRMPMSNSGSRASQESKAGKASSGRSSGRNATSKTASNKSSSSRSTSAKSSAGKGTTSRASAGRGASGAAKKSATGSRSKAKTGK